MWPEVTEMKLLYVRECAAEGKVSVPTVYRAITLGELASVRVGARGVRVVEESWRAYLESRRRPAIEQHGREPVMAIERDTVA